MQNAIVCCIMYICGFFFLATNMSKEKENIGVIDMRLEARRYEVFILASSKIGRIVYFVLLVYFLKWEVEGEGFGDILKIVSFFKIYNKGQYSQFWWCLVMVAQESIKEKAQIQSNLFSIVFFQLPAVKNWIFSRLHLRHPAFIPLVDLFPTLWACQLLLFVCVMSLLFVVFLFCFFGFF